MIGAALLAKNAVERGLSRKPWVKTSLAPGSKVVMDYYERAGLIPYLEKLGFHLVGYGCTTCIGNSGPIIDEVSTAVSANDLAVVSVLSGNRNFEGRINPDVKMNYLASPPLVVAYALAGTMDLDLTTEPLGEDADGQPVYLRDIWPTAQEIEQVVDEAIASEMFTRDYADVFTGDERWQDLSGPTTDTFEWDEGSTYVRKPPYFDGMARDPALVRDVAGARVLAKLGEWRAAGDPGRQGVRVRVVTRLGGQRHRAAWSASGDRRVLRADPPVEPHRHGRAAAAMRRWRDRGLARAHRRGGVLGRWRRSDQRRHDTTSRRGASGGHRVPGQAANRHARGSGLLPPRRHHAVRPAKLA
jgi:hypothetical protein